jgi:hypothetical protein
VSALGAIAHNNGCAQQGNPDFGTPWFGTKVHQSFREALMEQTGTSFDDWDMRVAPGQTGVDATYIGPDDTYPGFKHAELKPLSPWGLKQFEDQQLPSWLEKGMVNPGETQLWFYNEWGVIGSNGTNY